MIKINTKYLFTIFVLVMIFSIGVVSATENTTTSTNLDDNTIQERSTNMKIDEDNNLKEVNLLNEKNKMSPKTDGNEISYISPDATSTGDGSRENPFNISVAFNNTNIAGKNTFTLLEGEYKLKKAVSISKSYAKGILIQSEGNVTINGLNNINLFDIKTDNTVTINNITFINGYYANNGAAINNAANLTVINSTFTGNKASSGGAIYNNKGNLTVMNSNFINNEATGSGTSGYAGAILNSGNVTLINSTFTNNNGSKGGALYNNKGIIKIETENVFENNSALWAGVLYNSQATAVITNNNTFIDSSGKNYAGVINNEKGNLTIQNGNRFINNNGYTSGGVISSNLGNVIIEDNNYFNNNKAAYGGVINFTGNATIKNNNIFDNNNGSYAGGAIYTKSGNLTVDDKNIFANNTGYYYAACIYLWNASANVNDTTFTNNYANEGGCIYINTNSTDLTFNNLIFNNNSAQIGGAISTKVLTNINGSLFNDNNATTGGSIYAQGSLSITSCNFTNSNADEGGAIYATESSPAQISNSRFINITSNNETLNLQADNTLTSNYYENVSILYDNYKLEISNPKESYQKNENIEVETTIALTNPTYYDADILEHDSYTFYNNNQMIGQSDDNNYNLSFDEDGTYNVYATSKILGKNSNTIEIQVKSDATTDIKVNKVDVPASKGDLLVETNNTITINITNDATPTTATLNITIDNENTIVPLEDFTGEKIININYNPATTGAKNVKIDLTSDETTTNLYQATLNAYYNGYRGKSFTAGENFTTKRTYEGKNTLILEQYNYYNWNENTKATYDATQLENDKIVDVLYYQGYNWDKHLNFTLMVNGEESPIIANYSDTKGFGTYNYPSGLVVFNITQQFKTGQTNEIIPTQKTNNSNILYGGILIIIYANNTQTTTIQINEEADLLNPESSGLTTNDYTIAYSNYENTPTGEATLYTITAAADKTDGSQIIINNQQYGSLAQNYDTTSKLSIVQTKPDNLNEGNNTITLKSINDNLVTLGTILIITHPVNISLKVDTTNFTIGQNATIQASIYFDGIVASEINSGKVVFKINGKTIKDSNGKVIYAKVVNGTAKIENFTIPDSWNKNNLTIEAVYSGSGEYSSLRSEKEEVTIIKEPIFTTEDITTTVGGTITLKATLTDDSKVLNSGKVVFKINGKTVKDASGKTIYAKITNNIAKFDYTLPDSYKAKNYNITAVLISPDYDRLEDHKTLTVTNA